MVKLLRAGAVGLRLDTDASGWCQVSLQAGEREVELGADKSDLVEQRLAAGLADHLTGPFTGSIQGIPVQWIMSLAERHCTFYAAADGATRHLFIEGSDGSLVHTLQLSDADRRAWLDELSVSRG